MTQPKKPSAQDFLAAADDDNRALSDTGNGHLFVDILGRIVRYATDIDRWYVWNGMHWEPDTERRVKVLGLTQEVIRARREDILSSTGDDALDVDAQLRRLTQWESVSRKRSMLDIASTDHRIQVESEAFDTQANVLVCPNGAIDLDTGKVRPGESEDMNSRCCDVPFNPAARSDLFTEFLDTFLPDEEEQRFVFAVLGHALRGGNPRRTLPIIIGDTTSGKSQLFTALHKVLGTYICTIGASVFRGNLDDKPRPDLVMAMFTRIAWASEASKSWALHADQVKRLTGGEPLPYRNLYAGVVNKIPRFTPMLVTNVMPRITNADTALKRRILVLPFSHSLDPSKEDPRKKEAFLADKNTLMALLAVLVKGANDPIINEPPARFIYATMDAQGNVDHTDEFLQWMEEEGYLVKVPDSTPVSSMVKATHLYTAYTYWVKNFCDHIDRSDMLDLKGLGAALRSKGWESKPSAGIRWLGHQLHGSMVVIAGGVG